MEKDIKKNIKRLEHSISLGTATWHPVHLQSMRDNLKQLKQELKKWNTKTIHH